MYIKEKSKQYILLDVEGNSAHELEQRKITQFSALVFHDGMIEEVDMMNRNINFINSYVARMTKISVKKCKRQGVSEKHMISEIHRLISESEVVYAFGCDFDKNIINHMFLKYNLKTPTTPWYDVIKDVEKYLCPTKLKLSVSSTEYGFNDESFHNALTDCYATYHLMKTIESIRGATND